MGAFRANRLNMATGVHQKHFGSLDSLHIDLLLFSRSDGQRREGFELEVGHCPGGIRE